METTTESSLQTILLPYAQRFANFIDSRAGDYPLVSALPSDVGLAVLWQYCNHDFVIYFETTKRKFPSVKHLQKGSPSEISLLSLEEAIEFVRLTESIRQKTLYPHVALGRMLGTEFRQAQ